MGLLQPATNTTAYAKIGIMGFQGSGKTFTGSRIAKGLIDYIGDKAHRKVSFFDTETGSDFLIPYFKEHNIELFTHKGRAFTDAKSFIKESEKEDIDILIIDSVSHIWKELVQAYKKRFKRKYGLTISDWDPIKTEWSGFTDLFLNSKLHIFLLGRAGYEYDMEKDDSTGKWEVHKTGTKMKAEGEMGYEPSLLLEMEQVKSGDVGDKTIINRCHVIKDRADLLNGKVIDMPKFEDFLPFFKFLNLGGEHIGLDTSRTSASLFGDPEQSGIEIKRRREIILEKIQDALLRGGLDGRKADISVKRNDLLKKIFNTVSKTEIENMWPEQLEIGFRAIEVELKLVEPPKLEDLGELPA